MKEIKILSGTNCQNCELLYQVVSEIVKRKGIDAKVEKVVDIQEVLKYGVMTTPVLVVDGEVKHVGTPIPAPQKIEELIGG
ncbi:thioredoxin family protein [Aquifex aeolicus]|uniref:thioredoxin family protein n=1 Tax=Aquifex aeolicus TaxID=63363 RepID=UPI0003047544|nr:thioredoxin family protein [Aquifex aeolicus]